MPINEQYPFSKRWYSFKFHGPGLRYEVAVCIQTGHIVWVYGPIRCGEMNDLSIFRSNLKRLLAPGEMVEADAIYRSDSRVRGPNDCVSRADKSAKSRARARHETVNRRLKQFGCLKQRYRHGLQKHRQVFTAAAVCTQISFLNGEGPFQCEY